jgi:camphor 5-monooxygenase
MLSHLAALPPHVPPDCVVDLDLYRMPGLEEDLQAPWKALQDGSRRAVVWTPHNGGHWIVTRGRDIARIYADHENFSSRITLVPREFGEAWPLRPTTLDPPEHRPYRRLLNAAFSPAAVQAAGPVVRSLARRAAERIAPRGRCEFITEFAGPLPVAVFMHLADLPLDAANALPRYGEDALDADGSPAAVPIMERFAGFLRPYVAARRQQPGRDLISTIAAGTVDGRPITEDEAVEVATAALTGGLDTVVSTFALMMAFLARSRPHRERLVQDPGAINRAVAEMLRRFPIMTKARLVTRDQEIDGVTVKAGDMVVLPPLHGLDDREFSDPLIVDFDRPAALHAGFGHGVHRCPGALLTQVEIAVALHEWLDRIPEFAIDPSVPPRMRGGVLGTVLQLGLVWPTEGGPR